MTPITEETAVELLRAMQELTAAIRGGAMIHPHDTAPIKRQVDPAYLPGGIEWMKMATPQERREYNRSFTLKIRKEGRKQ